MKHLKSLALRISRQLSQAVDGGSTKLNTKRQQVYAFIATALLMLASQMSFALESMDNTVISKAESNVKPENKTAKNTSSEEAPLDLDDIKIKLIAKGSLKKQRLASKKIKGPNKLLLQQKIAAELKNTPESINAADLDILDLQLDTPAASVTVGESDAAFTTLKPD